MSFYPRCPFESLVISDPLFMSFRQPFGDEPLARLNLGLGASPSTTAVRTFSPKFDIHETAKEYVLEGELPGLEDKDKNKNLSIEFTDRNTMVIRGKIERSFTHGTPFASIEGVQMKGAIKAPTETKGEQSKDEKTEEQPKGEKTEAKDPKGREETVKYWVNERSVGTFQRSFSFPGDVDQDSVKACLENGILKVTVPKKEKAGTRKINIA